MTQPARRAALYTAVGIAAAVAVLAAALAALDEQQAPAQPRAAPGQGPAGAGAGPPHAPPITAAQAIDKSSFRTAPALEGIAAYINTAGAVDLESEIDGNVVLYDIWTYSCINCVRTLPYMTAWHEKYAGDGLTIVGIHSPEFEFEKDEDNVRRAVEKHGIDYPVVMDNDMETWDAFKNRYWPHRFLADHEGYIRYDHIGEGAYEQTERVMQTLLAERAAALGGGGGASAAAAAAGGGSGGLVDIAPFEHTRFMTPELYFGYSFAYGRNHLGNAEGFSPGAVVDYRLPEGAGERRGLFYVGGDWANEQGHMRLVSDGGSIVLRYYAKQVNIVAGAGGGGGEADVAVTLDGQPVPERLRGLDVLEARPAGGDAAAGTVVAVGEHGLYNIIDSSGEAEEHVLRLDAREPGLAMYTFTFG